MTKLEALELELAARKMVAGTELDWCKALRCEGVSQTTFKFDRPIGGYELAINIIEGKPVWKGDRYFNGDGDMCEAFTISLPLSKAYWARCTWNPPKPKTVMVELTVDDVEYLAGQYTRTKLREACRKALENLK